MAGSRLHDALRSLLRLTDRRGLAGLEDKQLLDRFVTTRDEAAFEALVARHGPMVLDVCRRVLSDPEAAEDAFQATFLVLTRKAGAIGRRELLGNWLYGVAYRTAQRAKVEAAKRRARESNAPPRQPADPLDEMTVREFFALLDAELYQLPDQYRAPLLLCYLQGQAREEVAGQLGWSLATLGRRLERGRELLRSRLTRHGLPLSAALCLTLLARGPAVAGVSPTLVAAVRRTALAAATGNSAVGGAASIHITRLAEGVIKTMYASQLKGLGLAVLLVASVGGLATITLPGGGVQRGPAVADKLRQEDVRASQLVRQLGSSSFAAREDAARRLRQMGLKALPVIRAGQRDSDREIARRCADLLPLIRDEQWKSFVERFNADRDRKGDFDHPVWLRFKKVVGDDRASRELFASMIADGHRARLLEAAEDDVPKAGDVYASEAGRIGKLAREGIPALPANVRGPRGPYREYHSPLAEIATLLYLGTYSGSARSSPEDTEIFALLRSDFGYPVRAASSLRPPLPRLFARWLDTRGKQDTIESGLRVALDLRIREVLPVARKVAADRAARPLTLGLALPLLGKFGDERDLPALAAVSDDRRECFRSRVDGKAVRTQVRDVAVAVRLLVRGQDPAKFGFPVLGTKPWRLSQDGAFELDWVGFWNDAAREATHKKALAWLNEQQATRP
jgi:RNA polymerase sigma factor (sigma-70 family)